MLSMEALLRMECPICLQPLKCRGEQQQQQQSPFRSPAFSASTSSPSLTTVGGTAGSTGNSDFRTPLPGGLGEENIDEGFRITFGTNVPRSTSLNARPQPPAFVTLESSDEDSTGASEDVEGTSDSPSRSSPSGSAPPRHLSSSGYADDDANSGEAAGGIAILPCGHLLHYLCAVQLCEYASKSSCPVCRKSLGSSSILIQFNPQLSKTRSFVTTTAERGEEPVSFDVGSRLHADGEASAALGCKRLRTEMGDMSDPKDRKAANAFDPLQFAPSRPSESSSARATAAPHVAVPGVPAASARSLGTSVEGADTNEITVLGARQLPPWQAYTELLLRTSSRWAVRTATLKTRVTDLEKSQQQLLSDCSELESILTAARHRREVLCLPSSRVARDTLAAAARLQELRKLCQQTRTDAATVTAQLAATVQDNIEVLRLIDKYTRKLARLEEGRYAVGD